MKGKVSLWKDDKGYGFIQPDDGSEKLFFHVSSVKTVARRPQTGDNVIFESVRDSKQRLKARGVVIEGVARNSRSPQKYRQNRIAPPQKNAVDYISVLVIFGSLAATGFEFYHSSAIESSWPFIIPGVIAFFILNRKKKPKDKSFNCACCHKIAEHDSRTIQAWNNGLVRLYCRTCHLQWLEDNPRQKHAQIQNRGSGCIGVMALIILIPALAGIYLYQWLS